MIDEHFPQEAVRRVVATALDEDLGPQSLDVTSTATIPAGTAIHEWVHDGRHLLGFPCH